MSIKQVIKLKGSIYTDYSGIKRLFEFYKEASKYKNRTLFVDLYSLEWIDANLASLFSAILYKLSDENQLSFSTDEKHLENKFDVLLRNGFFLKDNKRIKDERKSTVLLSFFESGSSKEFLHYVKNDLLNHRGMPNFDDKTKNGILNELIEVYNNYELHSKTCHPCFVCGQYYPKDKKIKFTIVDLGIGFFPAINKKEPKVKNDYDAINWALTPRNTTRVGCPGGLGLSRLKEHCETTNSEIQIITGNTFWSSELKDTIFDYRNFESPFVGSTINLLFSENLN